MFISNNFSDPNKEPQSDAAVICECQLSLVGVFDRGREPVDKEDLVVGSKNEVKNFDKEAGVVFTDVSPSVVLSSFFIASFSPEIVS